VGFFTKTVSDQDWLLDALPLYEATVQIVGTINWAFSGGYRRELNAAVDKVLDELPSLADRLARLPDPRSRAARLAKRDLRRSLHAYVRLAKEIRTLLELSAFVPNLYSAHLNVVGVIAGNAAQLMSDANEFFSRTWQMASVQTEPR